MENVLFCVCVLRKSGKDCREKGRMRFVENKEGRKMVKVNMNRKR
jgi:hypothetical protein